jgi:hypothetical protein
VGDTFLDRFWSRVDVRGPLDCWLWLGAKVTQGYGVFGKAVAAHRFSWELHNATPVLIGKEVCHTCDVRACLNPAHLWIGTHRDNMRDAFRKGRLRPGPGRPARPHVAKPLSARRRNELLMYASDPDLPAEERADFQAIIDRGVWWGPPTSTAAAKRPPLEDMLSAWAGARW